MSEGQRSLPEAWRAIDRLEADRDRYVRRDVYEANEKARDAGDRARDARITRMEADDTTKATGNRSWMLGLAQTAFGAILALLGAYLMTKGHG